MNRNGFLFSLSALLNVLDGDASLSSELFEEILDSAECCSGRDLEDYTEDAMWDRGLALKNEFSA